jgi:NADPH-ferrihemoprotein reductase
MRWIHIYDFPSVSSMPIFVHRLLRPNEAKHVYKGELALPWKMPERGFDSRNPFYADLITIRNLILDGSRVCLHVELNLTGSGLEYEAGDHLAMFPQNDPLDVEKFGYLLDLPSLDTIFTMSAVDASSSRRSPFPCPCSFRTALTHYVDFKAPLPVNTIKFLAQHTNSPEERHNLLGKIEPTNNEKYIEFFLTDRRSALDILEEFPSCRPPVFELLELLPRIRCRYYTISSSPRVYPHSSEYLLVLYYNLYFNSRSIRILYISRPFSSII